MSDNPTTSEEIIEEEVIVDEGRGTNFTHTVLEVWQKLLGNIDKERDLTITPQSSIAILASWPHLKVSEHSLYSSFYYSFLQEFKMIVDEVAEENPKAFKNVATDAEDNHDLYVEIIGEWQQAATDWEDSWDSSAEAAHVELAALADAINFALSSQGLVAHLDPIGFQLTEEDMKKMANTGEEEK